MGAQLYAEVKDDKGRVQPQPLVAMAIPVVHAQPVSGSMPVAQGRPVHTGAPDGEQMER